MGRTARVRQVQERRGISLRWKIPIAFASVVVLVSLLILGAAGQFLAQSLRSQLDKRVSSIALNLGDASAGHLASKDALRLNALVSKYGLLDGVAYASITDTQGKAVARNLAAGSPERRLAGDAFENGPVSLREVLFHGDRVIEARAPILDGRIGYAVVGVRAYEIEREIRDALARLAALAGIVLLIGLVISVWLARRMVRPIVRLTRMAEKISKGDLDSPIVIRARGELADLVVSLERMRASLKAAITRLTRQPLPERGALQEGGHHGQATI
jgi:nitrogen fixation/metabolism regulation signal transduction histidine kinase